MTKKQMHQEINKKFYEYVTEKFPHYIIDDSEGYGRVILVCTNPDDEMDSWDGSLIEYHQSRHNLCTYNWSSDQCKADEREMELFLNDLLANYNL